jgi:UDP-N-acetylmuramate dehydrogenase
VATASRALDPEQRTSLAPFSTLGVGGEARWFARAVDQHDVEAAHRWCAERNVPLVVLGGGSNIVVADEGIDGLVLHMGLEGLTFERRSGETFAGAGAGEVWDTLIAASVARGLAGLECLSGIPGSVGGSPIQNVGAYGQEVSDTIETVTAFDREQGEMRMLSAAECRFAYRTSRFKEGEAGRFIVCGVTFRLAPGPPTVTYSEVKAHIERSRTSTPTVGDVRSAVLSVRRSKGMVLDASDPDTRSVGSFFMNPVLTDNHRERLASLAGERVPGHMTGDGRVKVPAAWLIERAGFHKGRVDGAVGISTKHTLAIVNRGGATARDVLRLATHIKRSVADHFGVLLRPEPIFLGFGTNAELEYLRMDHR